MSRISIAMLECKAKIAAQYHVPSEDLDLVYVSENAKYYYFDIKNTADLKTKYNVDIWPHDRIAKADLQSILKLMELPPETGEDIQKVQKALAKPYPGYDASVSRIMSSLIQALTEFGKDKFYDAEVHRQAAQAVICNMPPDDYLRFDKQCPGTVALARYSVDEWPDEMYDKFADEYEAWQIKESMYGVSMLDAAETADVRSDINKLTRAAGLLANFFIKKGKDWNAAAKDVHDARHIIVQVSSSLYGRSGITGQVTGNDPMSRALTALWFANNALEGDDVNYAHKSVEEAIIHLQRLVDTEGQEPPPPIKYLLPARAEWRQY